MPTIDHGPAAAVAPPLPARQLGRLNVARMVVLGESLAAGLTDFALRAEFQRLSYPAQLARQLGADFRLPLIESPGLTQFSEDAAVHLPDLGQETIFSQFPPSSSFSNLSVPGFTLADALRIRPRPPLIERHNGKQTAANLLLDPRSLVEGKHDHPGTLVECGLRQTPTLLIIALGFSDVLEPLLNPRARMRGTNALAEDFERIFRAASLSSTDLLVMTVPNPIDTALVSSLTAAAQVLKTTPSCLRDLYKLRDDDYLTIPAMVEIACQIGQRQITRLDQGGVIPAVDAGRISARVLWLNNEIGRLAAKYRAIVCDLAGVFRRIREVGISVNSRHITGAFLGGFYSLNGFTPGPTGHALIANEIIRTLNDQFEASIGPIDVATVLAGDPVAAHRAASGRDWTLQELRAFATEARSPAVRSADLPKKDVTPGQGSSDRAPRFRSMEKSYNATYRDSPPEQLRLPPGLVQSLALVSESSYYGDAIHVVNAPAHSPFQATGTPSLVFGGLAMFVGHLAGTIRIAFTPPVNSLTHFEVQFDGGLSAHDGMIVAPELFKLPVLRGSVRVWPGKVCSGDLNLQTGDTSNLDFSFQFANSALAALVNVSPGFPQRPIQFPGPYGTALARFTQRKDGKLDFVFSGTAFVPLGPQARFPLPFASGSSDYASVPAAGTALHPHIHLSTFNKCSIDASRSRIDFRSNTVREFTACVAKTDFGDDFTLTSPELGFARGRSQLAGRALIQFGLCAGDSVPFAISVLPPGGSLFRQDIAFLQDLFPGDLNQGMLGHDSVLRFPMRDYRTTDMYLMNDPFDICWGLIDTRSGEVIGDHLHRAFFGQNVFFALVRVEPRTPRSSFEYRGPAFFERSVDGQWRYRFSGTVFLPYPEGFLFPKPNLAEGLPVGADSRLDPFFQLETVWRGKRCHTASSGGASSQIATTGDKFSYRYAISSDLVRPKPVFEYTNHTQGGSFRLKSVSWVDFMYTGSRTTSSQFDTITFSGFGSWSLDSKNELHQISVQISLPPSTPYISILIDGGQVSNVNSTLETVEPPLSAIPSESALRLRDGAGRGRHRG